MQQADVSLADKVCVFPVVQQIVGVSTIVSNLAKAVRDLVLLCIQERIIAQGKQKYRESINEKLALFKKDEMEKVLQEPRSKAENQENSVEQTVFQRLTSVVVQDSARGSDLPRVTTLSEEELRVVDAMKKRGHYHSLLFRHLAYAGIGMIRATFFLGSVYSVIILVRGKSI